MSVLIDFLRVCHANNQQRMSNLVYHFSHITYSLFIYFYFKMATTTTAAALCRDCDRSSYRCDDCRQQFCDYHLSEHRQDLTQQIDNLKLEYSNLKQILALPPSYQSLTEGTELINKINQWELETIQQIKEYAEQIREKARQRSQTITTERFPTEFQRLSQQFEDNNRLQTATESQIQQLTNQLNDLKIQIEQSLLTTADIHTTSIDWSKYLQITIKQDKLPQQRQLSIHLDRLTTRRARVSLDVRGADWHTLSTSSTIHSNFLHYQHTKHNKLLSLVDSNGEQTPLPWFDEQSIWDCCWSMYLNKYLILADTQVYIYDGETLSQNAFELIEKIRPKRDKMEFLRCTCSNDHLFLTYDERNSSIDEYHMQQWTLVRRHENIVKSNEIILSIATSETNSNLVGLTLLDDRKHWHFELRDRSLLLIASIQLDKSEFHRRVISLPNTNYNWLIVHTGSKYFMIVNENGQTKQLVDCPEAIDLAMYITNKNCLVALTQKSKLKFFDL